MNGDIEKVKALLGSGKVVIAQVAPAVRVALGEEFGAEVGTEVTEKIPEALKKLGFRYVFDTSVGADIVALEEAFELLARLEAGGPFPMFSSCCIGWKLHAYKFFPDKARQLSTCMAPQITLGAMAKTYFAEKVGLSREKIAVVSIMPCIAKKKEAELETEAGFEEVDLVLTTRELAQLLREKGINLMEMPASKFDPFLAEASISGRKFGASGGVAEAVLNVLYRVAGDNETQVKIEDDEEISYYTFNIGGKEINIIRLYGLSNFLKVLPKAEADYKDPNKKTYHLIEVMTCPYGCSGGPGQPLPISMEKNKKRAAALRAYANKQPIRDPYTNPEVRRIYDTYLTSIGSLRAKKLFHVGCEACKVSIKKMEEKGKGEGKK